MQPAQFMITRRSQWLLNLLDLRVVINERFIYPVPVQQPLLLTVAVPVFSFVVTNGFHISPRLQVSCPMGKTCRLQVSCRIEDHHLVGGLLSTLFCFLAGIIGGWVLFQVLCFVPALLLIHYFYLRRSRFLVVLLLPPV